MLVMCILCLFCIHVWGICTNGEVKFSHDCTSQKVISLYVPHRQWTVNSAESCRTLLHRLRLAMSLGGGEVWRSARLIYLPKYCSAGVLCIFFFCFRFFDGGGVKWNVLTRANCTILSVELNVEILFLVRNGACFFSILLQCFVWQLFEFRSEWKLKLIFIF